LGLIVEAKVGKGKLLICSADVSSNLDTRPVARQLAYSLQQYMVSSAFNPQTSVDLQVVKNLFDKSYNPNFNTYTKDAPDELKVKKNGMNP
jgi:outer membrane receptor for ferric coprogen and ferric-rhodotorulic acid